MKRWALILLLLAGCSGESKQAEKVPAPKYRVTLFTASGALFGIPTT
jgi:hypothetical protein